VTGTPALIVVSGPPGAGKTTLAHDLARAVGCPAICRDEIREGLVHAGTPDPDLTLTYRIFTGTVTALIRAGVTVVAEAAFQDHRWRPVLTPLLADASLRVIRCTVEPAVARARIARRSAPARAAHPGTPVEADAWAPIMLAVPTLVVDTTDGYSPAFPEIVAFAASPRSAAARSEPE
jgi:predicted kinase